MSENEGAPQQTANVDSIGAKRRQFPDLRRLKNAAPRWSRLKALSEHSSLKFAPVWLIIVPLLVKLILFLEEKEILPSGVRMVLPESMEVLFAGGVAALLASVVFSLLSPGLVANYPSFTEFEGAGKGPDVLSIEFAEDLKACQPPSRWIANNLREISADYCEQPLSEADLPAMASDRELCVQKAQALRIRDDQMGNAFWAMRRYVDDLRPVGRYAYLVLLVVAVGCTTYVLGRNIWMAGKFIARGESPVIATSTTDTGATETTGTAAPDTTETNVIRREPPSLVLALYSKARDKTLADLVSELKPLEENGLAKVQFNLATVDPSLVRDLASTNAEIVIVHAHALTDTSLFREIKDEKLRSEAIAREAERELVGLLGALAEDNPSVTFIIYSRAFANDSREADRLLNRLEKKKGGERITALRASKRIETIAIPSIPSGTDLPNDVALDLREMIARILAPN